MPAKKGVKKRGRPPKPKGETLGKPTPIRFLAGEIKLFEKKAQDEGLTLSEWIRKTLNKAMNQ